LLKARRKQEQAYKEKKQLYKDHGLPPPPPPGFSFVDLLIVAYPQAGSKAAKHVKRGERISEEKLAQMIASGEAEGLDYEADYTSSEAGKRRQSTRARTMTVSARQGRRRRGTVAMGGRKSRAGHRGSIGAGHRGSIGAGHRGSIELSGNRVQQLEAQREDFEKNIKRLMQMFADPPISEAQAKHALLTADQDMSLAVELIITKVVPSGPVGAPQSPKPPPPPDDPPVRQGGAKIADAAARVDVRQEASAVGPAVAVGGGADWI